MVRRPVNFITGLGYALNLPALVIWLAVGLKELGLPLGESLGDWLYATFSEFTLLIFWLAMPASALIFGLGVFVMGQKRGVSVGLIGLSSLLVLVVAGAALQAG